MAEEKRDYYLKIDGVDGESQDQSHPGAIRVHDFNLAETNRGNRAGYAVGRPYFDDVTFIAPIDASYTKLNETCLKNMQVPKVVLTCRKAGLNQYDFLLITFNKVYVTNCRVDTLGETPTVEFTLSFGKIQVDYRGQKQEGALGGSVSAIFDLSRGKTEDQS